jgi:translation initiation factor RLI1
VGKRLKAVDKKGLFSEAVEKLDLESILEREIQ